MTAALPLGEPKSAGDGAQFIVSDGLVGRPAEEALQSFVVSSRPANLAFPRTLALSNAQVQLQANISNASAASYQRSLVCCNARSAAGAQEHNVVSWSPPMLTRRRNACGFLDES